MHKRSGRILTGVGARLGSGRATATERSENTNSKMYCTRLWELCGCSGKPNTTQNNIEVGRSGAKRSEAHRSRENPTSRGEAKRNRTTRNHAERREVKRCEAKQIEARRNAGIQSKDKRNAAKRNKATQKEAKRGPLGLRLGLGPTSVHPAEQQGAIS